MNAPPCDIPASDELGLDPITCPNCGSPVWEITSCDSCGFHGCRKCAERHTCTKTPSSVTGDDQVVENRGLVPPRPETP